MVPNPENNHMVCIPYPGRGHINPMLNFCKSLASRKQDIQITIIVTEEWFSLLDPNDDGPSNASFVTIPNVIPSEFSRRGSDPAGFIEAVTTKMEEAVEKILDGLNPPPKLILATTFLLWAINLGKRKGIPVASFWPSSASAFSAYYHQELVARKQHYPSDLSGSLDEHINYIPGLSSIRLIDLPHSFQSHNMRVMNFIKEAMHWVSKAEYILFRTLYDLEGPVIDALQSIVPTPIYTIGPAIPYFKLLAQGASDMKGSDGHTSRKHPYYLKWLHNQPESSVLYVSMGSYLSTSPAQLEELAIGLRDSGLSYLWVAREDTTKLKATCGEKGLIVPWCDQIKVLSHPSTGGFLTHCGWNSALESAFAGIPTLNFPLTADQPLNSKVMAEDWKMGWKMKDRVDTGESLITREDVIGIVKKFMDTQNHERKELDKRCKKFQKRLQVEFSKGRESEAELDRFIADSLRLQQRIDLAFKPSLRPLLIFTMASVVRHIVSVPFPGHGHVNPMINFCKSLASQRQDVQITIIVTEEWLSLIGDKDERPPNASFVTIPNVLPSELIRGSDHAGFLEAVLTKMEEPVEKILSGINPAPHIIIADMFVPWAVDVGKRRGIPVGSFCPMSASCFSAFYHQELLVQNQHYPTDVSGSTEERIDYIPGIDSIRLVDLPDPFQSHKVRVLNVVKDAMFGASKAQYFLFRTLYDLEAPAIDVLKSILPSPSYTIGPAIPYSKLLSSGTFSDTKASNGHIGGTKPDYLKWLDNQNKSSVLFVSLGSYLSTSLEQLEEIATGLRDSEVSYLWVAREDTKKLKAACRQKGLIIPWCDQIKVLSHESTGGFLSHCGWNSTLESAFAGVPVLTFPLTADQPLNSKVLAEDWKTAWRMKERVCKNERLITAQEITTLVKRFMDLENNERKKLDNRCKELQERLQVGVGKAISEAEIDRFVADSLRY